jgi:uridine kinase
MQKQHKLVIVGVAGGTSSGKTTIADRLYADLSQYKHKSVVIISQDSFYKDLNQEHLELARTNNYNFDHPDAIEFSLLKSTLQRLIAGEHDVEIPIYDFHKHQRSPQTIKIPNNPDIIIIEGIFIFWDPEIRNMMNIKLFVDVEADTRLLRRIRRDTEYRDRDLVQILDAYEKYVKPGYNAFIEPTKTYADLIIPNGGNNEVAIRILKDTLYHLG